jgi:hypothetical protein
MAVPDLETRILIKNCDGGASTEGFKPTVNAKMLYITNGTA